MFSVQGGVQCAVCSVQYCVQCAVCSVQCDGKTVDVGPAMALRGREVTLLMVT